MTRPEFRPDVRVCRVCRRARPSVAFGRYPNGHVHTYCRRCGPQRMGGGPGHGRYDAAIAKLVPRDGVAVDQYELAEMIGCTRGYVSMVEAKAMATLRRKHPRLAMWLDEIGKQQNRHPLAVAQDLAGNWEE